MRFSALILILSALLLAGAHPAFAQDDADVPGGGYGQFTRAAVDEGGRTDSDVVPVRGDASDVSGSGALAFGVVYSNGNKYSGTTNWTSSYNPTYKRYEIQISGENYYYLNYTTIITPAGDALFCRSSSVSGMLLVYCNDHNGNGAPARFGFVTYKAS